ncbi:MAG: methionine--tRNA ligase [Solirubrobacteraceae bacterium]|jgi:methionyl-tRNA synthetase
MPTFYVTTPIYYVNAAPHLGHAYTSIAADILTRHARIAGKEAFFLTGVDEHGEPVVLAAERDAVTPQQLVDLNAERFRELTRLLELSNDFFIRTTDAGHMTRVQEILQRVHDAGHTYRGIYEGWYCPRCADFKGDSEIGPDNSCPIHQIPLERESEDNWFFRLSTFQAPLERLFADRPDFVMPRHAYNEAHSFLSQGLQDVSLTRAKLSWGVPVPWQPDHVFYVWFDALLNYVTALGYAREGESLERFWPADFHLIGKDILKFHTIYWPALLMAAGLEPPRHVFVHGFLLSPLDGALEKMSKSRGNVLDPFAIIAEFGADALRHYLFREVTFGADGPVSLEGFRSRYDAELANEYGNLASRTLNMLERYSGGTVASVALDAELVRDFAGLAGRVDALLDRAEISAALEEIWQHVRRLNRYVEEHAPWRLARDEERTDELTRVLASLAEGLRVVTVALNPYMPAKTATLLDALGRPSLTAREYSVLGWGGPVGALAPLFPKTAR